jgi:hypothetical protein
VFSILNHIKPNGTLTSQTFWEWVSVVLQQSHPKAHHFPFSANEAQIFPLPAQLFLHASAYCRHFARLCIDHLNDVNAGVKIHHWPE